MSTAPTLALDPATLATLADMIANRGIQQVAADVQQLVTRLRCQGVHGVALDVLADDRQPAVARERAFGIVHGLALATATPAATGHLVAA